jgi:hypothetical protein
MTRAAHRWYALLLRCFPTDFRRDFGDDVLRLISDQIDDAARVDVLRCHFAATLDLATALARQRAAYLLRGTGWLLMGLAAANIGYDVVTPKLSMGFFAWALTFVAIASGVLLAGHASTRRRRA